MKKILLLLFTLFLITASFSQGTMKTRKWRVTENDSLAKAQAIFEARNYPIAWRYFNNIRQNHPTELYLRYVLGVCDLYKGDRHEEALTFLSETYEKNKKTLEIEIDMARAYHYNYKFDEALGMLDLFLKRKNLTDIQKKEALQLQDWCNNAKPLVAAPLAAKVQNIGKIVNTDNAEYSPAIASDESTMVFTYVGTESVGGLQNELNRPDSAGSYNEDVYISHKENGSWSKPKSLGEFINTNFNDGVAALSNDGQKLLISRDDGSDGGDIYMSTLEGNVWSVPEKLKGEINTPAWEGSASLSADEKTLFFSSERSGGSGGKDIYKATLREDGTWGNVQNLGVEINTFLDDDAPFIHPDGKTLTFCSIGGKGMGYFDIYISRLNVADSTWSKPENIGYPINTVDDDHFFVLSASGKRGYYSSERAGGSGLEDIYAIDMPENFPKPIVETVKGNVTKDGKSAQAEVIVDISNKNKSYANYHSNSVTGNYLVNVTPGNNYKFTFKLKGFPDQVQTIDATGLTTYVEKIMDVAFVTKKDSVPAVDATLAANSDAKNGDTKTAGNKTDAGSKNATSSDQSDKNSTTESINIGNKYGISNATVTTKNGANSTNNAGTKTNSNNSGSKGDKTSVVEAAVASKYGNAAKEGLVFKIQIAALKSPQNFDLNKVKGLGKTEKLVLDDGITRITVGSFKTLNEALDFKKKVRASGLPDAFVTAIYKGKRVYLVELESMGLIQLDK